MQRGSLVTNNVLWFMGSLALAFFVWIIATSAADPITPKTFTGVQIQFQVSDGLILTNPSRRTVTVNVRARKSVTDLLTSEDITVQADLTNAAAGTQTVQLTALVARSRQAVADTQPSQISVTLEPKLSEQKPIEVRILNEPPAGFLRGATTTSETQMLVTGIESKVQQIVKLEAQINLSDQRNTFDQDVELIPLDANGMRVTDVTVAQPLHVTIQINQDDTVQLVFVTPNVNRDSLSDDYVFLGIVDYNPKTISVTGSPPALATLPDTLQTRLIDLTNATGETTVSIPVELPSGIFLVQPGETIQVTIGIEAREEIKQLDRVPVEIVGADSTIQAQVVPDRVTVLVRGPKPILEELTVANLRIVIDVQGLATGEHEQIPVASVNIGQIPAENISVLPSTIRVTIVDTTVTPQAETTEQVQP